MKKTVAMLLVVVLTIGLAACGTQSQSEMPSTEPPVSNIQIEPDAADSSPIQEPPPAPSAPPASSTPPETPSSVTPSSIAPPVSSSPPPVSSKPESKAGPTPPSASSPSPKPESKSEPVPAVTTPPDGTGTTDLYFTLNGATIDTDTMEKKKGGGNHDSDGDGVKENIGFSLLIELMGKKPEQLADTGIIEFMDGTTVSKSVGDLVQSVVVFKSNDASINDKWGDYNLRYRFMCNDVPMPYVKSVTWAVK